MASTIATASTLRQPSVLRTNLIEQIREGLSAPQTRWLLAGATASFALLILIFWPNLRYMAHTWQTDENYSHGFLVPLLALYFANEAASRGTVPIRGGVCLGVLLLVISILGRLATIVIPVGIVGDLAYLIGLAGICSLFGGVRVLRRFAFPLAFLIFMVPLPIALYSAIASPLQLLVSRVASVLLNATGIPVLRDGNIMTLPGGVQMFVAEACSGMRQLTGFLALTTAVAYLSPRPSWYRATLIASSIPIAMTANVIRVFATGSIMFHLDPRFALGTYHTAEGLLMMGLGLGLLGLECQLLGRLVPARPEPGPERMDHTANRGSTRSFFGSPAFRLICGLAVLTVGLGAQIGVEGAMPTSRPPLKRSLESLSLQLGGWDGQDVPIDPLVLRESQADDHVNRVYTNPDHPGVRLSLWINYSVTGLNLRHSPEVCLPSGGWEKQEARTRILPIGRPAGEPVPVTRLVYKQGELVQGVGFWYYIFGEGSLEKVVRHLPITSRSSHGRATRGSGLTVEIFCPGDHDPDGQSLRDFASSLLAELEPMLPDDRAQYHRP